MFLFFSGLVAGIGEVPLLAEGVEKLHGLEGFIERHAGAFGEVVLKAVVYFFDLILEAGRAAGDVLVGLMMLLEDELIG